MPTGDTLLLVRHAEPAIDPAAPAAAWRLAPRGRRQCARLAEALRRHAPGHLVSSPEPKAVETAELVAAALGVGCSVAAGLEEHHRETVRLLPDFRAQVAALFARPDQLVLGEETAAAAAARFARALEAVLAAWRWPGPPCVVSHGTVLALHAAGRLGLDPFALWDRLRCPSLIVLAAGEAAIETDFEP